MTWSRPCCHRLWRRRWRRGGRVSPRSRGRPARGGGGRGGRHVAPVVAVEEHRRRVRSEVHLEGKYCAVIINADWSSAWLPSSKESPKRWGFYNMTKKYSKDQYSVLLRCEAVRFQTWLSAYYAILAEIAIMHGMVEISWEGLRF